MSAEEIRFPPAERRDPRTFEAPPWEQKQFEELQERRRVEAPPEPQEPAAVQAAEPIAVQTTAEAPEPASAAPEEAVAAKAEAGAAPVAAEETEDPAVRAMMAQLAAEERTDTRSIRMVSIASGALLAVIGCVLIVWGVAAFVVSRRAGAVGAFGGAVLLLFGAGFVAGGAWIGTRQLR